MTASVRNAGAPSDAVATPAADPATDPVALAERVAPIIAAAAEEIEATRRLPDPVVAALTGAGLFDLYRPVGVGSSPAGVGGAPVDPVTAMQAMEVLARADGSAAWCAHVSCANAWQLATLDADAVAAMEDPPGSLRRFSGSNRPRGTARKVAGGYVLNGRWDFASNCLHAQWYCAACTAEDHGRQQVKGLFVPTTQVTVIDTWEVAGLRGTGSHDVVIDQVFVPDERVSAGRHLAVQTSPLFHRRLGMVVNWALTAGVALGIARGALDAFCGISTRGTAGAVETPLRDRASVQGAVGRAEATLGAARAYCLNSVGAVWAGAESGQDDSRLDGCIPAARLAIVHAMHAAVEVVNLLFHAGGTHSVYTRNRLERCFRDAQVASQHGAGSPSHFEAGGRLALGLPAGAPAW